MSLQTSKSHHIDKRADGVAAQIIGLDPNALLCTKEVATLFGVSPKWLEIGRHRGYGPPFIRISARRIRYKTADLIAWLEERKHRSTSEYMKSGSNGTREREAA